MSTVQDATRMLSFATAYGLDGVSKYIDYPIETLAARWNGIGPESMDEAKRKKLDKWLRLYKPACFIHDQDFAESDGTRGGFNAANDRLERNCLIIADDNYEWYDPRRYLARRGGRLVADACRIVGWRAWTDAAKKRGTNDAEFPQHFHDNSDACKLPANEITAQI